MPSKREQIVAAWAAGRTHPEIADQLGVSRNHVSVARSIARSKGDARAFRKEVRRRDAETPHDAATGTPGPALSKRERILDMWAAGLSNPQNARRMETSRNYVRVVLSVARSKGDPRAARKLRGGVQPPAMSHRSRGINRTREQSAALKQAVLDMWNEGMDGHEVARSCGIDRAYVHSITKRARQAGDPRADRRKALPFVHDGRTLSQHVRIMHESGMGIPSIAALVERKPRRVVEALCRLRA